MRILNELGGIELAAAYTCIKAISKKKEETIAKIREQFVAGRDEQRAEAQRGRSSSASMIIKFAGYGFNKSHSTAYALIAYMTAYLKAHYPVEFMAALLSGDIQGRNFKKKDSLVEHLEDCQRMEIDGAAAGREPLRRRVRCQPARQESGPIISFGLSAIKGCGGRRRGDRRRAKQGRPVPRPVRFLRAGRSARLQPRDDRNADQSRRVRPLGGRRAQLWPCSSGRCKPARPRSPIAAAGRKGCSTRPTTSRRTRRQAAEPARHARMGRARALGDEKEVLGFYLTSHPLAEHADSWPRTARTPPRRCPACPIAPK